MKSKEILMSEAKIEDKLCLVFKIIFEEMKDLLIQLFNGGHMLEKFFNFING